jgi:hypothetical protein
MGASTGVQPIADYSGAASGGAAIDLLVALIPDVDTTSSSGAQAGGGFLDEMSPAAAVQLRVELAAMRAVIAAFN